MGAEYELVAVIYEVTVGTGQANHFTTQLRLGTTWLKYDCLQGGATTAANVFDGTWHTGSEHIYVYLRKSTSSPIASPDLDLTLCHQENVHPTDRNDGASVFRASVFDLNDEDYIFDLNDVADDGAGMFDLNDGADDRAYMFDLNDEDSVFDLNNSYRDDEPFDLNDVIEE